VIDQLYTQEKPPQRVPTFEEAVQFMSENTDFVLNIDVKMDNDPEKLFTLMDKILSSSKEKDKLGRRIVLGLWHPLFIDPAKRILPYTRISHIGFSTNYARKWFWRDCESFSVHIAALLTHGGQRFVDDCHKEGKELIVWTCNSREEMLAATRWNARAVMTDQNRKLLRLQEEYKKDPERMQVEIRESRVGWRDMAYYVLLRYIIFDLLGTFFILYMGGPIHR